MSTHTEPHHGPDTTTDPKEHDVHDSLEPHRFAQDLRHGRHRPADPDRNHGGRVLHRSRRLQRRGGAVHRLLKASIVVLFFMHVKYSSRLTKLTLFSGLFLFSVLISLTLSDYMTRAWGRW